MRFITKLIVGYFLINMYPVSLTACDSCSRYSDTVTVETPFKTIEMVAKYPYSVAYIVNKELLHSIYDLSYRLLDEKQRVFSPLGRFLPVCYIEFLNTHFDDARLVFEKDTNSLKNFDLISKIVVDQYDCDVNLFTMTLTFQFLTTNNQMIASRKISANRIKAGIDMWDTSTTSDSIEMIFSQLHKELQGDPSFVINDFKDARSVKNISPFLASLNKAKTPLARFILEKFSPDLLKALKKIKKKEKQFPQYLESVFIEELNATLEGGLLYEKDRFKGVLLSEKTRKLLSQEDEKKDSILINRLLLEDAYPEYIEKRVFTLYDALKKFNIHHKDM